SGLAAGTYTISAVYGGDTNDAGSTGTGAAQLVVNKFATTTDLVSSTTTGPNPQLVLVAAILTAAGSLPTGTVTFSDGTTAIGTVTLDASGVATLVPSLSSGNHSIVAVYSGDATHSPSTSQQISVTGTGGTFSVGINPPTVNIKTSQNLTMTVTVTSSNGFADTIGLG